MASGVEGLDMAQDQCTGPMAVLTQGSGLGGVLVAQAHSHSKTVRSSGATGKNTTAKFLL